MWGRKKKTDAEADASPEVAGAEPHVTPPPAEPTDTGDDAGLTGLISSLSADSPAENPEPPSEPFVGMADAGSAADDALTTVLPVVGAESTSADHDVPVSAPVAAPMAPAPGELSDAQAAALAAGTIPAATPTPETTPATAAVPIDGVDMGPEKRSRWWLWTLLAVLVLLLAGGAGYAWWWGEARPIPVPDIVGKEQAEATQILNDVDLRLGDVSELPTDAAPPGTIVTQDPEAGTRLEPGTPVSFVVSSEPTHTHVPEVTGVTSDDAGAELAKARLRPILVESYAATAAAGSVIAQMPAPGAEQSHGSPVVLVVSKGPAPANAAVPRLTGLTEADAVTLLKAAKLKSAVYRSPNASITVGTVMGQSPAAGTSAPYESAVQILVSQGAGAATVTMPQVVGQSKAATVKQLKSLGLVAQSRAVVHPTAPKDQVVSQMPAPGTKVAAGAIVGLLVSRGSTNDAPVPSLVGTTSVAAEAAVKQAGFRPKLVTVGVEGQVPGTVYLQFPLASTMYTRGFPVVYLVAAVPK